MARSDQIYDVVKIVWEKFDVPGIFACGTELRLIDENCSMEPFDAIAWAPLKVHVG